MIDILHQRIQNNELELRKTDFDIIHQDILQYTHKKENYKIIANIPYYITSPILFRFLYEIENPPQEMIILMQKEV
jgi:16S rRNA (adenine1518-N6/adenine1519-N6)-dimethyltransferase